MIMKYLLTMDHIFATACKSVREEHRRNGLASALLSQAKAHAKAHKASCIRLHVDPERKGTDQNLSGATENALL